MADILDYQAQHYLRKYIRRLEGDDYKQLKSILYCNQSVAPQIGAVFLLGDDKNHSMFHGHTTCKNPFCCPVCSSMMMEHYRERINAAIQILKPTHFGFMTTFTMPHYGFMGWRETMDILYEAHDYFRRKSFSKRCGHAYQDFNKLYPVEHSVKVCEFTWSKKNGAHPHFHCLWWIPRDKFDNDEILKWESELDSFWLKTLKRVAIRYWKQHNLHINGRESLEHLAHRLFFTSDQVKYAGGTIAFKISAKDGQIIEAVNGDYISGWGADNEMTGNYRKEASHEGHMTPYQMLVESFHDKELRDEYIKFCLAVTQKPVHHRVRFSTGKGLCKRIDAFLKEQKQRETKSLQKKSKWEVVTYFDENEWYLLCDLDDSMAPILSNILWYAAHRRDLLAEYLNSLGLEIHSNKHRSQSDIEKKYCG